MIPWPHFTADCSFGRYIFGRCGGITLLVPFRINTLVSVMTISSLANEAAERVREKIGGVFHVQEIATYIILESIAQTVFGSHDFNAASPPKMND